jgi:CubicO group peptidase (beta-lactamase class C family)
MRMSVHGSRGSIALLAALLFVIGAGMRGPARATRHKGDVSRHFPDSIPNLVGLWKAHRHLGPEVRGPLIVDHPAGQWRASIAGRTVVARAQRDTLSFELPDSTGSFVGRFDRTGNTITGQWIQSRTALPLTLVSCGASCYSGDVVPLEIEYTFYMKVARRADGSLGAFLRNPERNLGVFIRVDHIEVDGSKLKLLDKKGELVLPAVVNHDVITVYIDGRGGSYDFQRIPDGAFTNFYPRGHPRASYSYVPPMARSDGWSVGKLSDVGMSQQKISAFMQTLIDNPVDSLGSLYLHGLLIARHGKLVLEEYFYGENGEKPHDTRSAAKSVLSVMIGAAEEKGAPITPETRVYSVMEPGVGGLDPRKQSLTVEHLVNMTSGLDCDDGDDNSPGNEDNLTQQANPDWYSAILNLKSIRNPGDTAVYCSINPHLAGGVLARVTKRPLPDLMWDLVGKPLQMRNYYMGLSPTGDGYMGGGMRFRPRDFMKLGQLYLNGGVWHSKRIVSTDWIKRTTVPRYRMGRLTSYGYLWWMIDYPYQGRTVQAYFASGNGGNEVMVIPALDMVVAVYGGNYNDWIAGWAMVKDLIPKYVLPAIER